MVFCFPLCASSNEPTWLCVRMHEHGTHIPIDERQQ